MTVRAVVAGAVALFRVFIATAALCLVLPPAELTSQVARPLLGVTLAHSISSGTAAWPDSCISTCQARDVLAPISISSVEIDAAFPLRSLPRYGLDYVVRAVPVIVARDNPTGTATHGRLGW